MISLYHLCLFLHLAAIFVLAIAMGVSHRGLVRLEKAESRAAALENCDLVIENSLLFPMSTLVIVATGLYMGISSWPMTAPWIVLSLVFVICSAITGFLVIVPRLNAIRGHLVALPDGPLSEEASIKRRDPVAALLPSALAGNALGTALVMVTKPGWLEAIAIFTVFSLLGLVPVWSRAQEAARGWKRAREFARLGRAHDGYGGTGLPILCDVLDPKLVVVESVSPFTLKAHKAMKAAGLEYITRRTTQAGDYKHLNPKGQIPILILGSEIICGSREIVRYCAKKAPDVFEIALSAEKQAENHFWEEYSENTLKGFVAYARWALDENWERAKAAYFVDMPLVLRPIIIPNVRKAILRLLKNMDVGRAGVEQEWTRYLDVLDMLETRAPASGYWLGTQKLTPCDISLYAFLQCLRTSVTPAHHEAMLKRVRLSAYLRRVEQVTERAPAARAEPIAVAV